MNTEQEKEHAIAEAAAQHMEKWAAAQDWGTISPKISAGGGNLLISFDKLPVDQARRNSIMGMHAMNAKAGKLSVSPQAYADAQTHSSLLPPELTTLSYESQLAVEGAAKINRVKNALRTENIVRRDPRLGGELLAHDAITMTFARNKDDTALAILSIPAEKLIAAEDRGVQSASAVR